MKYITVYHNLNYDTYYYKIINFCNYEVGYVNQFNHQLILIIDINYICKTCYYRNIHYSKKKKVLRKVISFLQNIEKKL